MDPDNYFTLMNVIFICSCYYDKFHRKDTPAPFRRYAVRPTFQLRQHLGEFNNFFREIREGDPEIFFKYTRMSNRTYQELLNLLKNKLEKKARTCRRISAEERLAFTLRCVYNKKKSFYPINKKRPNTEMS
jgi:hypothetical protein